MQEAVLNQYVDEIWNLFDVNNDGYLSESEMSLMFNDLFARIGDNRTYSPEQVRSFFRQADTNSDGRVDKAEFHRILRILLQARPYTGTVRTYVVAPTNYRYESYLTRPSYKVGGTYYTTSGLGGTTYTTSGLGGSTYTTSGLGGTTYTTSSLHGGNIIGGSGLTGTTVVGGSGLGGGYTTTKVTTTTTTTSSSYR